jgi:RHS repeat-associated protein
MPNKSGVAEQILSLPKGGGSIKGLGEKFQPDLHTGTGNFSIPITVPPGRSDFQPELSLNYSTGSGNGPFGLGWSISVPNVSRKISKGIPRYHDQFDAQGNPIWHEDEDVFILSGAEDLVHVGNGYYRPRTEGLFARIQKVKAPDGKPCWVVTAKDGVRSIYGKTPESRLFIEEDGVMKIFQWLLSETEDTNGNKIVYEYKNDDGADLQADMATYPEERNHIYNQVYLKSIVYVDYQEPGANDEKFLWKIELDYGEYNDAGNEVTPWNVRPDPFSSYRSGFEIRTARQCRRILIKRRLDGVADQYEIIRSYELNYQQAPFSNTSLLTEVILHGHRNGVTESFPPLTFGYTDFNPTKRKYEIFSAQCDYLPEKSLSDPNYELIDLHGNGLPGIIHTSPTGYRYWRNMGNMQFVVPRPMRNFPAGVTLTDDGVQFADMGGNGSADLLVTTGAMRGYYANDFSGEWQQFHHYRQAPSFDLKDPDVKLVDMDGDGVIDVLATHKHHFLYIRNTNRGNGLTFAQPRAIPRKHDLDEFPDVFFSAPDQRVRLADMTGDGMQDVVLIHDRLIQYWPNLGHGRFSKQITLWNAPDLPHRYDPKRLFLSDVNEDGLADLIYVDSGKVHLWINQNGNQWSDEVVIHGTPPVTDADAVRVVDMKGTGTQGILWSYDYALQYKKNYKYLDFTGGVKPLLMSSIDNHIGARTTIMYLTSTDYYIADAEAGRPWKTTLPFPVNVVSKVVVEDAVTGNKLTTRYNYHHGYYDGKEREFRGFGRVEHYDAEEFPGDPDAVAPALTKTWFHLGNSVDLSDEYFDEKSFADLFHVPQLSTPLAGFLSTRDSRRALRGSVLRSELYGVDGTAVSHIPYTVTKNTYKVEKIFIPADDSPENLKEIWFPHPHAARTSHYERMNEPRTNLVQAEFTQLGAMPLDLYYNQTKEERIGFGRKPGTGVDFQEVTLKTITETHYAELNQAAGAPVDLGMAYLPVYIVDQPKEIIVKDKMGNVLSLTRTYYDGPAFIGLPHRTPANPGLEITHGNPTRVEVVVLNDAIIAETYGANPPDIFNFGYYPDPKLLGYYAINQERREFNKRGQVIGIMDPLGNPTAASRLATVKYDPYELFPEKVTDGASFTTKVAYDYVAMSASVVEDPNSTKTFYDYDALGRLTATASGKTLNNGAAVGDSLNIPTIQYKYNLNFLPAQYDPVTNNRVIEAKPIYLNTMRLEKSGLPVQLDHAAGKYTNVFETYEYFDGFGRSIQTRAEAEPGPLDSISNPNAQPNDPEWVSNRWVVSGWQEYNNIGEVAKKYHPRFADTSAYQSEVMDPQLKDTPFFQYFFDPVGRVIRTVDPDKIRSTVKFTPWEKEFHDPNDNGDQIPNNDSHYGHNVAGFDVKSKYGTHIHTPRTELYDPLGKVVAVCEDNGWWDAAGNQVLEGTADAIRQLYTTRYEYDLLGRLLRIFDARDLTWTQAAVSAGLATIPDVGQLRPTFKQVSDLTGRKLLVQHTTAAGPRRYAFDAVGNQVWSEDARGIVTTTEYDMLDRPLAIYVGKGVNKKLRELYTYRPFTPGDTFAQDNNLFGPVEVIQDAAGKVAFTYDYLGLVKTKTRWLWADNWSDWQNSNSVFWNRNEPEFHRAVPKDDARGLTSVPNYPGGFKVVYEYDAMSRVTGTVYPDNSRVERIYNDGCLLEKIRFYNNGVAAITIIQNIDYRENGQRLRVTYGNGVMTQYSYDPVSYRLLRIKTQQGGGVKLQDLEYIYDPVGNIVQISDRLSDQIIDDTQIITNTRSFEYDPLYRLIKVQGRNHKDAIADKCKSHAFVAALKPPPNSNDLQNLYQNYTFDYRYDAVGNFQRNEEYLNAVLQYESVMPDHFNGAWSEVNEYSYDINGNMTRSPCHPLLAWDYEDQLAYAELNVSNVPAALQQVRYFYDTDGNRVLKISKGHRFVIYIDNMFDLVIKQQNGKLLQCRYKHIYDGNGHVALFEDGICDAPQPLLYYHNDHLGSAYIITKPNGSCFSQEDYSPFGQTSDRRLAKNQFRYNGKEMDEETGLYYFGTRYYMPWIGRWISPDPVGPIDENNPYVYASNNPIRYVDAKGLQSTEPGSEEGAGSLTPSSTPTGTKQPGSKVHLFEVRVGEPWGGTREERQKVEQLIRRKFNAEKLTSGSRLSRLLKAKMLVFTGHHWVRHGYPAGSFHPMYPRPHPLAGHAITSQGINLNRVMRMRIARMYLPLVSYEARLIIVSGCYTLFNKPGSRSAEFFHNKFPNALVLGWYSGSPKRKGDFYERFLVNLPENINLVDDKNIIIREWKKHIAETYREWSQSKNRGLRKAAHTIPGYMTPEGEVYIYNLKENRWPLKLRVGQK